MSDSSKKECDAMLEEYNLECKDVNLLCWKEEIIQHAKGTIFIIYLDICKLCKTMFVCPSFTSCSSLSVSSVHVSSVSLLFLLFSYPKKIGIIKKKNWDAEFT